MAHQCLKCGKTYPDGSPQILKGCEGCKGTRFFYTDAPLADAAREQLAQKTEIDIERLALGKGAQGPARTIPTKEELPLGQPRDWVELGPQYLRNVVEEVVKRAQDKTPVFRVGGPAPANKPTLAEWVRQSPVEATAPDPDLLLEELIDPQRERAWRDAAHGVTEAAAPTPAPAAGTPGADEVVYRRTKRAPRPVSLDGDEIEAPVDEELREKARAALDAARTRTPDVLPDNVEGSGEDASIYPEGQAPETVAVRSAGVYELDVKRLLEKQPIIVHKDGSYALHLPSLMETLKRKG